MNLKIVLRSLGMLLVCECLTLLVPTITALIYKDGDLSSFIFTMFILLACAIPMLLIKPKDKNIYPKEGFAIVAIGWLLISFFGALPFYFSGAIPSLIDAFFESSSGFTTTGSTILSEIESLPHGILLWRCFTHWVGGMGILLLTIALLPSMGMGSMQVMKAESPGPIVGKIVPKLGSTAKILYGIYLCLTLLEVVCLMLAGMNFYDALLHSFSTVGTGGFSNRNISVGYYDSALIDGIITVFMILSGINFSLYYFILKGNLKSFWKDQELRLYLFILSAATILIMFNLLYTGYYDSVGTAFRYTSFQVASVMTTTGYMTADYNLWPMFSKILLLLIMFIGGCAGSTAGGIKISRILIGFRSILYSFKRIIHPKACYVVRLNDKKVDSQTVMSVTNYFFVYMFVFFTGVLIISINNFDAATTITSVIATLNNVGPGIEIVGPAGNFSTFSDLSKFTFSLLMIIGRVEIYPILLLVLPELWKKN
ncbi:MAG: TrkH family potassium uptake protein [Cellulosilyticum sp.]|nr:TrkH family potassium uptake protein [Cellulosilyticum sp.]